MAKEDFISEPERRGVSRGWRPNWDLIAICLILVGAFAPYFSSKVFPVSDTRNTYCSFYYFYNHVAQEGEFPLWLPYGLYGVTASLVQVRDLSVPAYFVGGVGRLFHAGDVLALDKTAVLIEEFVFVFGFYLLARRLYARRLTIFLVTTAAALSTVWYFNIAFNLRFFYCIPLAMYLVLRFLQEKRAWLLWSVGLVLLLSLPGMSQYFFAMVLFLMFVWHLFLLPRYWRAYGCVATRDWKSWLALGLLLATAALLGDAVRSSLTGLRLYAGGRDPVTSKTTLECFLTYGGVMTPGMFTGFFPGGRTTLYHDFSLYVGILPLLVLPLGFLHRQRELFHSFLGTALVMLLVSLGGTFAHLAYYFPLVAFYRHLAFVIVLTKVLLLLAAGFGLEVLWDRLPGLCRRERFISLPVLVLALVTAWIVFDGAYGADYRAGLFKTPVEELHNLTAMRVSLLIYPVGLLAMFVLQHRLQRRPGVAGLIVAGVWLVDMAAFQYGVYATRPLTNWPGGLRMSPLTYIQRRSGTIEDAAQAERARILSEVAESYPEVTVFYQHYMNMIQLDTRFPRARVDFFAAGADQLIRLRGGNPKWYPDREFLPPVDTDPALWAVLGCSAPKLRVVKNAVIVHTEDELRSAITNIVDLDKTVVLRRRDDNLGDALALTAPTGGGSASSRDGVDATIGVTKFNANVIQVAATLPSAEAAWLVYADAWHAGWHATVNGKPVPVWEAYGAFKAVRLNPGVNNVEFRFDDGIHTWEMRLLPVISIAATLVLLAAAGCVMFSKHPPAKFQPAENEGAGDSSI